MMIASSCNTAKPGTIAEIHARFSAGTLTPRELLARCLAVIDDREAEVKAWVSLFREEAIRLAEEQTAKLERGEFDCCRSPLFGIPIGVKDIFDCVDKPTLAGSRLRSNEPAANDCKAVARLRRAGAIILGKTTTTEFACFDPAPTHNPRRLGHTPGGSSSGSAAAVAAGMCIAAIGSQTGGSIIRPASFCGVVGYKPSFGAIPTTGVVPVAHSLDHVGPIVRSVADAARMFAVMAELPDHRAIEPASSIRLGRIDPFFIEKAEASARACYEKTLETLERRFDATTELSFSEADFITQMHRNHRTIMAVECALYHREAYLPKSDRYGRTLAALIEEGLSVSPELYAATLEFRKAMIVYFGSIFARIDLICVPATCGSAPATLESTGDPRWQSPWSLIGFSAITLPCGVDAAGLPLGLQLIAANDRTLLAAASAIETLLQAQLPDEYRL